ncbi:hypothetical protein V2K88_02910 [Pseudomonas alliivorans]|nr:hypothetical protein [Pseudomonas alliivorans]
MLSWDEFDKQDEDEFFRISSRKLMDAESVREATVHCGDSAALRRAKAALDSLDMAAGLAKLEASSCRNPGKLYARRFNGQTTTFCGEGVYGLYDVHQYFARVTETLKFFNKLVLIFAACLLSSICCSRFTSARNAEFRTPLFACDAELSIDRHRLRTAF